jgi:hypothetical protein
MVFALGWNSSPHYLPDRGNALQFCILSLHVRVVRLTAFPDTNHDRSLSFTALSERRSEHGVHSEVAD